MEKLLKIITRNLILLFKARELGFFDRIRLKFVPRYQSATAAFSGKKITLTDASSFVAMYEELFLKKIYSFKAKNEKPYIIDCGANIGLSIIFFKQLYPQAKIVAFEPDGLIFKTLNDNINAFNFTGVVLEQKAVWNEDTELSFHSEGGLSGHVSKNTEEKSLSVSAFRLKNLLIQPVDFLKIDIEGAEYEVIKDCKNELKQVENLFVEYHSRLSEPQRLNEILGWITEAGFRYHIQEAYVSQQPFLHINLMGDMDLQLNIFAYRPQ